MNLSYEDLVKEQHAYQSLCLLFDCAVPADTFESLAHGYSVQNGLLVRKWTPFTDTSVGEPWLQVVVPATAKEAVMKTTHDMLGHSGVRKTCDCIMRHFYWPRLRRDVAASIKACHICQMTGKPNQVNQAGAFAADTSGGWSL